MTPERQSAASAAKEFLDKRTGIWQPELQKVSVLRLVSPDDLAALLDAREAELLAQIAALHGALRRTMRYLGADDENATEQESSRRAAMTALDSTAEAAREHDQRVRNEYMQLVLDGAAVLLQQHITDADTLDKVMATLSGLCAHGELTDEQKAWAHAVARSQTEGA